MPEARPGERVERSPLGWAQQQASMGLPGTTVTSVHQSPVARPRTPALNGSVLRYGCADLADTLLSARSASPAAFPTAVVLEPPA